MGIPVRPWTLFAPAKSFPLRFTDFPENPRAPEEIYFLDLSRGLGLLFSEKGRWNSLLEPLLEDVVGDSQVDLPLEGVGDLLPDFLPYGHPLDHFVFRGMIDGNAGLFVLGD